MSQVSSCIAGRRCVIEQTGRGGPTLFWGTMAGGDMQREAVVRLVRAQLPGRPFALVCFEAEDWNRDFSPWAAPGVRPGEAFGGGGPDTLSWLLSACMPWAAEALGADAPRLTGGYSLGGLFALHAFYESGAFAGAASCSGSLWFPGWLDYMKDRRAPQDSRVYLSLGVKEERTKNAAMAAVGEMTRRTHALLEADENVAKTQLVWHGGGHFADVEKRIAQGFAWLIGQA